MQRFRQLKQNLVGSKRDSQKIQPKQQQFLQKFISTELEFYGISPSSYKIPRIVNHRNNHTVDDNQNKIPNFVVNNDNNSNNNSKIQLAFLKKKKFPATIIEQSTEDIHESKSISEFQQNNSSRITFIKSTTRNLPQGNNNVKAKDIRQNESINHKNSQTSKSKGSTTVKKIQQNQYEQHHQKSNHIDYLSEQAKQTIQSQLKKRKTSCESLNLNNHQNKNFQIQTQIKRQFSSICNNDFELDYYTLILQLTAELNLSRLNQQKSNEKSILKQIKNIIRYIEKDKQALINDKNKENISCKSVLENPIQQSKRKIKKSQRLHQKLQISNNSCNSDHGSSHSYGSFIQSSISNKQNKRSSQKYKYQQNIELNRKSIKQFQLQGKSASSLVEKSSKNENDENCSHNSSSLTNNANNNTFMSEFQEEEKQQYDFQQKQYRNMINNENRQKDSSCQQIAQVQITCQNSPSLHNQRHHQNKNNQILEHDFEQQSNQQNQQYQKQQQNEKQRYHSLEHQNEQLNYFSQQQEYEQALSQISQHQSEYMASLTVSRAQSKTAMMKTAPVKTNNRSVADKESQKQRVSGFTHEVYGCGMKTPVNDLNSDLSEEGDERYYQDQLQSQEQSNKKNHQKQKRKYFHKRIPSSPSNTQLIDFKNSKDLFQQSIEYKRIVYMLDSEYNVDRNAIILSEDKKSSHSGTFSNSNINSLFSSDNSHNNNHKVRSGNKNAKNSINNDMNYYLNNDNDDNDDSCYDKSDPSFRKEIFQSNSDKHHQGKCLMKNLAELFDRSENAAYQQSQEIENQKSQQRYLTYLQSQGKDKHFNNNNNFESVVDNDDYSQSHKSLFSSQRNNKYTLSQNHQHQSSNSIQDKLSSECYPQSHYSYDENINQNQNRLSQRVNNDEHYNNKYHLSHQIESVILFSTLRNNNNQQNSQRLIVKKNDSNRQNNSKRNQNKQNTSIKSSQESYISQRSQKQRYSIIRKKNKSKTQKLSPSEQPQYQHQHQQQQQHKSSIFSDLSFRTHYQDKLSMTTGDNLQFVVKKTSRVNKSNRNNKEYIHNGQQQQNTNDNKENIKLLFQKIMVKKIQAKQQKSKRRQQLQIEKLFKNNSSSSMSNSQISSSFSNNEEHSNGNENSQRDDISVSGSRKQQIKYKILQLDNSKNDKNNGNIINSDSSRNIIIGENKSNSRLIQNGISHSNLQKYNKAKNMIKEPTDKRKVLKDINSLLKVRETQRAANK